MVHGKASPACRLNWKPGWGASAAGAGATARAQAAALTAAGAFAWVHAVTRLGAWICMQVCPPKPLTGSEAIGYKILRQYYQRGKCGTCMSTALADLNATLDVA
jgi:hypothetical protein